MRTTAASDPQPKIYLTAKIESGGGSVWQWVGTDGFDYSPVLTNYKEALEYPEKNHLEKIY